MKTLKYRQLVSLLFLCSTVVLFQNFSRDEALPSERISIKKLKLNRTRAFAALCGPRKKFEVCYEGDPIAGSNQAAHLNWDNPIDDDWDSAVAKKDSWKYIRDRAGRTFMHVDRTVRGYEGRTGHIWRRDEFISSKSGFEALVSVKILSQSDEQGVKFHYFDENHEFKIVFNPYEITFHEFIGNSAKVIARQRRRNTSWTVFKIRKAPKTGLVTLWANGYRLFSRDTLKPGKTKLYSPIEGKVGRIKTRIGFGDINNYVRDHQGAYQLDFLRYRRLLRKGTRRPHKLPETEVCKKSKWRYLRNNFRAKHFRFTRLGASISKITKGVFARTLETDIQLLRAKNKEDGYSVEYADKIGGVILSIFADRIEMKSNTKPGKPSVIRPVGFDPLSINKYRLVRSTNGLYWNLYLNDKPVPVMTDVKASGISLRKPLFFIGPYTTPAYTDVKTHEESKARIHNSTKAAVSLIRWSEGELASNRCSN